MCLGLFAPEPLIGLKWPNLASSHFDHRPHAPTSPPFPVPALPWLATIPTLVAIRTIRAHQALIQSEKRYSDSSDSDYLSLRHHQAEPLPDSPRTQRQQEVEWIANQVYSPSWTIAALAARSGDRGLALLLLQSMDWKLRAGTLNQPMKNLLGMGFEEFSVRVCLLAHDGGERLALEELLQGGCYVDVNGHHNVF